MRVEVISTAAHLHRVAVLLQTSGLQWRLHAAPTAGLLVSDLRRIVLSEAVGAAALRVFGPRVEPVLHGAVFIMGRIDYGCLQIRLRLHV